MNYFDIFSSNTLAPTSNQSFFYSSGEKIKSRAFYKIFSAGKFKYSLLFSNIIDSTFSDGSHSQANHLCKEWTIYSATAYLIDAQETDFENPKILNKKEITFGGKKSKKVEIGELFSTDAFDFCANKGDYFCLELEFAGEELPYFEEILIPTYVYNGEKWIYDKKTPLCAMIGIDREIDKRVVFLGDSITEGLGTPLNEYAGWASKIAEKSSDENSYWNLGIGFARATDASSDGSWLFKAKQSDVATVCLGTNDICQGKSADVIIDAIENIVNILKENKIRTILFTLPPFEYIVENMSKKTEIFDMISPLGKKGEENICIYGDHPNALGCEAVANEFVKLIKL